MKPKQKTPTITRKNTLQTKACSPHKEAKTTKRKSTKKTSKEILWAKGCSPYEKLRQSISWRKCGLGPKYIKAIAQEYLEWGEKPTSIEPIEFRQQFGIPKRTFDKLKQDHEILREAHEYVKELIGMRRERLAMYKKYECDPKTIARTLHIYHPAWTKTLEDERNFRKSLSQQEEKPTNITIEMNEIKEEDPLGEE